MPDIKTKIIVGEGYQALITHLSGLNMKNTHEALKASATLVASVWKMYATGAPIEGSSIRIKKASGTYARSIKVRKLGNFNYEVISNDPKAESIENGHPDIDLKKIIPFGPKSRMGKNGPYGIVPFSIGTPGRMRTSMPSSLYNRIRKSIKGGEFQRSRVGEQVRFEENAAGDLVPRATYDWGSKVSSEDPNLQNMVAFEVPGGVGGKVRSSFMTFRIITANKPKNYDKTSRGKSWEDSWIVPAKQGLHITDHVKRNTQQYIVDLLESAVEKDLGV